MRGSIMSSARDTQSSKYSKPDYPMWSMFIDTSISTHQPLAVVVLHDQKILFHSYTGYFFEKFDLDFYLNKKNKSVLQLGAMTGKPLIEYRDLGWQTTAYDYCDNAVAYIPITLQDANKGECRI